MMIHGWCLKCHKVKRVRVTMPRQGVNVGICMDCERGPRAEADPR